MVERGTFRSARWRYAFVSGLLASASALPVMAATATTDASSPGAAAVAEVIVTATKREENLQRVAVSVQALTPTILTQHQVSSADDYIKLLPSVSFQSFGPGQSQLYFRGITSGGDGLHIGSEPATGVYVDEVPLTTIANSVDLHIYDMARVEALSGPQGTLFGASSLSGTLRLITNQPDPHHFSAGVDGQVDGFTDGAPGGLVEGYVNIPINEKVAIRLVAFDEHEGGYIDNIAKTRVFNLTPGSDPATGDTLTENNSRFVKNNFNDVDTYGGRAALRLDLDDSWSITPAVIYQHQKANGNFLVNPALGDLKVADFSPDLNVDEWYLASMTIKGKIANWDVLYAGGWFHRTVLNRADYSYYAVAYDAAGYTSYVTYPDGHGGFLDPDQQFNSFDDYTKQSHEFRVSSPADQPVRFLGGLFYERQTNLTTSDYVIPGLAASGALNPSGTDIAAVPTAGDDIFYKHLNRVDRDFALFGELAWDIRENLTLTLGGRYFTANNTLLGFSGFSGNALDPTTCFASTAITQVPCVNVNAKVTRVRRDAQGELELADRPRADALRHLLHRFQAGRDQPPRARRLRAALQPRHGRQLRARLEDYLARWRPEVQRRDLRRRVARRSVRSLAARRCGRDDHRQRRRRALLRPRGRCGVAADGGPHAHRIRHGAARRLDPDFLQLQLKRRSDRLRAQGHAAAGAAGLQGQRQRPLRVLGP